MLWLCKGPFCTRTLASAGGSGEMTIPSLNCGPSRVSVSSDSVQLGHWRGGQWGRGTRSTLGYRLFSQGKVSYRGVIAADSWCTRRNFSDSQAEGRHLRWRERHAEKLRAQPILGIAGCLVSPNAKCEVGSGKVRGEKRSMHVALHLMSSSWAPNCVDSCRWQPSSRYGAYITFG